MEMKARKYEAFKRGDFSGMTEKERMESVIDVRLSPFDQWEVGWWQFERRSDIDEWSEHSSDEDESARPARAIASGSGRRDDVSLNRARRRYSW
jgi:hypothetical protein